MCQLAGALMGVVITAVLVPHAEPPRRGRAESSDAGRGDNALAVPGHLEHVCEEGEGGATGGKHERVSHPVPPELTAYILRVVCGGEEDGGG